MKAVILQDYLRSGGTERQAVFLAQQLQERGHRICFVTFRPNGIISSDLAGINHRALQPFDTHLDWLGLGLSKVVRESVPDCILCMGTVANSYAGLLQIKFPSTPVISTVRTGKTLSRCYKWSLRKTSHVIVNTNWWKNELISLGLSDERISVVYNAVLPNHCGATNELERNKLRGRFNVTPNMCVFVCVQEFRFGKRHRDLIWCFSHLKTISGWKLWLIGDGGERRRCERLVRELDLQERVQFFGYKSNPMPFYAGADVAVSASLEDSLPNFLIEAQAAGLPVIARDYKGVRESLISGNSGFLYHKSGSSEFAKAACELMQDKRLRVKMGEVGRRFVQQQFDTAQQAQRTEEILQSVLSKRAPLRPLDIVISRPDRIGDVVVTTTCFAVIKRSFPNARLYLIVQDYIVPLLSDHPLIDKVIGLSSKESTKQRLQDQLRKLQPCCIIHLHFNALVEDAAKGAGIQCRIGFSFRGSTQGLTSVLFDNKKRCEKHEAEYNFELLHTIGIKTTGTLRPYLSPRLRAKHSLKRKCPWLENSRPYAALHLTAFAGKISIPPKVFVNLASWLHRTYQVNIVLVGDEICHPSVSHFTKTLGNRAWMFDTVGSLDLAELAWLLGGSSLTVGRDSGLTHISAAMGTVTFTIMVPLGKTLASKRWRPLGPRTAFLEKRIDPFVLETVRHYHQRYVESITVNDIQDGITALLKKFNVSGSINGGNIEPPAGVPWEQRLIAY